MRTGIYAAAVAACFVWSTSATAGTIDATGTTDVTVAEGFLQILENNSIAATPIIPATVGAVPPPATFFFPITGGDLSTLTIEHSGGVEFSKGSSSLKATNFLIDGLAGTVSATINDGPVLPILDLFEPVVGSTITAELRVNAILSNAIVDIFLMGDPDVQDNNLLEATFGSATTSPQPVPLPASALLLIAGVGGFTAFRRRKAAA
ncbi:MAG: VPLPA-CTERM sorting domain-containing protein [Pseudomonadota bacterium]